MAKHKNHNFRAYHSFGNSYNCISQEPTGCWAPLSVQLNGMLMMWKIHWAMQDDAIRAARVHVAFMPVTGLK